MCSKNTNNDNKTTEHRSKIQDTYDRIWWWVMNRKIIKGFLLIRIQKKKKQSTRKGGQKENLKLIDIIMIWNY